MTSLRACAALTLTALLISVSSVRGQQGNLHVGYVYPAGGRQGLRFEAVIAGQCVTGVEQSYVTGGGVQVEIVELIKPIAGKELDELSDSKSTSCWPARLSFSRTSERWSSSAASRTPSRSRKTPAAEDQEWRS